MVASCGVKSEYMRVNGVVVAQTTREERGNGGGLGGGLS